jgi:hypothetical protein
MVRVRASRRLQLGVKLAFTSLLQLEFSQRHSQHDPCVVDSTVESFLRRVFISLWRSGTPGAQIPDLARTQYVCANYVENPDRMIFALPQPTQIKAITPPDLFVG